jgi:hypothetical protein
MKPKSLVFAIGVLCSCVLIVSVAKAQQEDAAGQDKLLNLPEADKAEYQRVAGTWKTTREWQGRTYSGNKTHKGGKSEVSFLDSEGKLLHTHTSEYKLKRLGDIRIFVYFNRKVTAGPNKGDERPGVQRYIYKVVDDQFFEIQGAFASQQGKPSIIVWDRVNPEAKTPQ